MTLSQARLLFRILIHGPFEVSTSATTAKVCVHRGWLVRQDAWGRHALTDAGKAALKQCFPEILDLYETNQALSRGYHDARNELEQMRELA